MEREILHKKDCGRGIAADLVKFALEYAKEHALKVKSTCSCVKVYMERHKELYGDMVDTGVIFY